MAAKRRPRGMDPEVLTANGAATMLGVSKSTVLRLAAAGKLPGRKVGKQWRFLRSRLLRWIGESEPQGNVIERLVQSGKAEYL